MSFFICPSIVPKLALASLPCITGGAGMFESGWLGTTGRVCPFRFASSISLLINPATSLVSLSWEDAAGFRGESTVGDELTGPVLPAIGGRIGSGGRLSVIGSLISLVWNAFISDILYPFVG